MKAFSYDFNLSSENQLAKNLYLAGTKRKFAEVASNFILALRDEKVQGVSDNEKVVGRFLAVRNPIFSFFLVRTLSNEVHSVCGDQNVIKGVVEKAFSGRRKYLEEVINQCRLTLTTIAAEDEELLKPASKRNITNLAKDVFTLSGNAIENITNNIPDKISEYFKEAINNIYSSGLGLEFFQIEDSRDVFILAFSFIGSNLPNEDLEPRLGYLKEALEREPSYWDCFTRNLNNVQEFCRTQSTDADNLGWDAVYHAFRMATGNRAIRPTTQIKPGSGYYGGLYNGRHAPRVEGTAMNLGQPRGYGSFADSIPQGKSSRVMVKVDYELLRTETNDSMRLEVMLSAIDYLIGFKTNGERNVYSLSSLVRYLNLKADAEAMSIIIATFTENEYLLNKSELHLACASLLPWIPEVSLDQSGNPRIKEYNAFRTRIEKYVTDFNRN